MKLIILNGPTGVGKSTLAVALHEQMPSSVVVDIDELRRTIPDYRERAVESARLSYEMATNAIEENLKAGKDVIVDKTISDTGVLDAFIASAAACGADAYEFLLFGSKEGVQARADARGYRPGSLLTPEKVGKHWDRADAHRAQRSNAVVIDTTNLSPDEVLACVSDALNP